MDYKIDFQREGFTWSNTFSAISLPQFHKVAEFLDFPVTISTELPQLAHDFAFDYYEMIMNRPDLEGYSAFQTLLTAPVPETVHFDLFKGAPSEDTNETYYERKAKLYENTFHHLDAMGVAEEIYRWGRQTQIYYQHRADRQSFFDFESLNDWLRVLREWAVLEWFAHNPNCKVGDEIGEGTGFTYNFAPYTSIEERYAQLNKLPLSDAAYTIQTIILDHEGKKLQFRRIIDELKATPQSLWEQFCWNTYTWMSNEGRHRLNLKAWFQIYDLLSLDEMHIMDDWMRQHQDDYSYLKVPLPDFRAILYGGD